MIVLDAAGIHPFQGEKPPFATSFALGDIEEHLFTDKHKSVFIAVPSAKEEGKLAFLAIRILLDNDLLPVPKTDYVSNLNEYFSVLPKRATIYAMRNGRLLNYSVDDLRRDWNRFFSKNSFHRHLAAKRYKTARQALIEFHTCTDRGNRFFQQLTKSLFGRVTAYTEEQASRVLFGAAIVLEFKRFMNPGVPLPKF